MYSSYNLFEFLSIVINRESDFILSYTKYVLKVIEFKILGTLLIKSIKLLLRRVMLGLKTDETFCTEAASDASVAFICCYNDMKQNIYDTENKDYKNRRKKNFKIKKNLLRVGLEHAPLQCPDC